MRSLLHLCSVMFCLSSLTSAFAQTASVPRNVIDERLLTFSAYHSPALHPNGELLAYVSLSVTPEGAIRHDLWVQNLRTGARAQLSRNSDCFHPCWSPSGDLIAVAAIQRDRPTASAGLWVMRGDGTRQTQIVSAPLSDPPLAPSWCPTNPNLIAFFSTMELVPGSNPSRRLNVWTVNIATSDLVPHFVPPDLEISALSGPAWQADGKALYFLASPTPAVTPAGAAPEARQPQTPSPSVWRLDLESSTFTEALPPQDYYVFKSLASVPALDALSALLIPPPGSLRSSATLAILGKRPGAAHVIKSDLTPPAGESDVLFPQAVTWSGDGRTCVVVTGRDLTLLELATRAEVESKGCAANMRKLYAAFVAYTQAHQGRLPEAGLDADRQPRWVAAIIPYLRDLSVLRCPLDDGDQTSYEFNADLGGKVLVYLENRETTPLLTERVPRHQGRATVLTADGRVRLR